MALLDDLERAKAIRKQLNIIESREGKIIPFTQHTKPDYELAWHNELTGKYLDAFIKKEIRFLMIFEPPRHGKSELTSRRTPALIHGLYPNDEILACSYNADSASDFTIDVQRIIDSPAYGEIFPTVRIPKSPGRYARSSSEHEILPWQDPVDKLWLYHTGSYNSAGVGGSFTGKGANWIFVDDPIKNRQDADSAAFREALWKFYRSTLRTRLEKNGSILITLTRWHEDDLAGRILEDMKTNPYADKFVVLSLPAIMENLEEKHPLDPRGIGEALWPSKYDVTDLMALKGDAREWSALYQQTPRIEGGNIIKRDEIQYYDVQPNPEEMDAMCISADLATKKKQASDFYVYSVYGRKGSQFYLFPTQYRGRWTFPMALGQFKTAIVEWPEAVAKLVEAKANGPALVQTLEEEISGLIEIEPQGDKVARLNAVAPLYQAGNVWYPSPRIAPWIDDHVNEMCGFPFMKYDDRVDAETQALSYLKQRGPVYEPTTGHGQYGGEGERR